MATSSSQMLSFTNSGYSDDTGGYIRQTALNGSSLSGQINFTGLGTGTDMSEVVDKLVAVESIQMNRLSSWKSTWESKIEAITALNQRLLAVEQGAADMLTMNKFLSRQVASSNSSAVSAQVSSDASLGAYQVTVGGGEANPIKHIFRSVGFASPDTVCSDDVAGQVLTLSTGGQSYDITLPANATLQDIADAINAQSGGAITAIIENDGTFSNPYHLQLTSAGGGSSAQITCSANPTWISFDSRDMLLESNAANIPVSLAGMYTGDKANGYRALYEVTLSSENGTDPVKIGEEKFSITWKVAWDDEDLGTVTQEHTIEVPANYKPGTPIELEDGLMIVLEAGSVASGSSFIVRAFAGNIDDVETASDWTGPAITSSGHYLGSINKTYNFAVATTGELDGTQALTISWSDSTGKSGKFVVMDPNEPYEVEQGVYISFADTGEDLVQGQRFSLDVYAKDLQQAQDTGLAQAAKAVHSGFSDYDITPLTSKAATFSYTYGGHEVTVAVPEGYTLSQLVRLINEDSDNPGVSASYINDGLGLPNSWKLVLTGKNTGQEYQLSNISHTFTGGNFAGGGELGGGFELTQQATNSMIKVDGYPKGDTWLQRPYNQVADAITGVNLTLNSAGTSTVTVSVDTAAVYDKVEAFINAINLVQDYIREATKYEANTSGDYSSNSESTHNAGILIGNYAFYIIKTEIDGLLSSRPQGLTAGKDTFTLLSEIGIESDPDNNGTWTINSTKLNAALTKDAEGVAKLFIGIEDPSGTIVTDKDTPEEKHWSLLGVAERAMQKIKKLTASPSTKTVEGKDVTTPGGPLNVLISNYNDIIANIDKRIINEEKRIALYKERLTLRFARLETTISMLNNKSSAIESAINGLPSMGKD